MSVFTPLPNTTYAMPFAQVLFRPQGKDRFVNLGDAETISITPELTEVERYGKDSDTRVLRFSAVTQKGGTLTLTLLQLTETVKSMLFMADKDSYLVQSAIADGEVTFENVAAGDIFSLGASDVTVTGITDGEVSPVSYTAGTHYRVDRRTGYVEIIAVPAGAGDDVVIAFTAPAILNTAKRFSGGLMQNNGIRGTLFIRGQGAFGANEEVHLWDVELRPSGDIELQGGDDVQQVELTGKMFADGTQPNGFQYGRIQTIPKTALA